METLRAPGVSAMLFHSHELPGFCWRTWLWTQCKHSIMTIDSTSTSLDHPHKLIHEDCVTLKVILPNPPLITSESIHKVCQLVLPSRPQKCPHNQPSMKSHFHSHPHCPTKEKQIVRVCWIKVFKLINNSRSKTKENHKRDGFGNTIKHLHKLSPSFSSEAHICLRSCIKHLH